MTASRTERLVNLLIMLLVQRRAVGKDRIREILYPGSSHDGFERMFDRDKEELRSIGVPIELVPLDAYFDDEVGYRIKASEFALPDIELTADEAAVVGLATKVWEHSRLADATTQAVRKLTAYGVDVDVAALDLMETRIGADEPSFDVFWAAALERTPVVFDYARRGGQAQTRHLQPWGVVRYSGRWYVVGYDTDRAGERIFRLSRVVETARLDGRPGSYSIPEGTDIRSIAERLAPSPPAESAVVLVRVGAAATLRRRTDDIQVDVGGPPGESWDRITLPPGTWSADELLTFGADVVVEQPDTLRETVIARLTAAAEKAVPA